MAVRMQNANNGRLCSAATALVSGLVACLRSNPTYSAYKSPAQVKQLIRELARAVSYKGVPNASKPPVIYNGQTRDRSCVPGSNDASLPRERRLSPRQADDVCQLPGNGGGDGPRGPPVTFRPGPPGPLCTGASGCGKLCTASTCSGLVPSITLPPRPTSTGFSMCRSTTTFRQCNGSPHNNVCITTSSCALHGFPDAPTLSTSAPYSPPGGSCVSSTTWTELGGPKFEATITKSSCASWSTPMASTTAPPVVTATPTLGPVTCNKRGAFPGQGDVIAGKVSEYGGLYCADLAGASYRLGPGQHKDNEKGNYRGVPYWYKVAWVDGCTLAGIKDQLVWRPLQLTDPDENTKLTISCPELFQKAYADCKYDSFHSSPLFLPPVKQVHTG